MAKRLATSSVRVYHLMNSTGTQVGQDIGEISRESYEAHDQFGWSVAVSREGVELPLGLLEGEITFPAHTSITQT
jgi:hypothetical protein